MPVLEHDNLVFRFPQIEMEANFSINFQRTLRIPDSDETYSLPPGLGAFPIRHAEDYLERLPEATKSRGGVILPMWQAEAMWLNFNNEGPHWDLDFPVAVKIAAGKINAITGEDWRSGLHRDPQDYMVSPEQPWIDGFAVERGVIRQFVAMPLGEGYSVEEQLNGEAQWGGLQISVAPLKAHVWKAKRAEWERASKEEEEVLYMRMNIDACVYSEASSMGLAAGGRMRQVIHPDPFELADWDFAAADRVFVTLLHAKDWKKVTGEAAANLPPTAKEYSDAGLPWFDHYGKDRNSLPGSPILGGVKSVGSLFKTLTGATLPDSEDVGVGARIAIGPGAKSGRPIRLGDEWD